MRALRDQEADVSNLAEAQVELRRLEDKVSLDQPAQDGIQGEDEVGEVLLEVKDVVDVHEGLLEALEDPVHNLDEGRGCTLEAEGHPSPAHQPERRVEAGVVSRIPVKQDLVEAGEKVGYREDATGDLTEVSQHVVQRPSEELSDGVKAAEVADRPLGPVRLGHEVHVGTPWAVADVAQLMESEYVQERRSLVELPDKHTQSGRIPMHAAVPRMSETPAKMRTEAPEIGEHNSSIYDELGFSNLELATLKEDGVI